MAARVLLQRRAAPLTAAALIGGVALAPATAFAEAPEGRPVKKPIYDDYELVPTKGPLAPPPTAQSTEPPTTTATTATSSSTPPASTPTIASTIFSPSEQQEPARSHGPTPTDRLAVQIGKARVHLYRYALAAEDAVNRTMDRAFDLEQSFTGTIASLAPPRDSGEKLMPGSIYVLVAAMAGSIVTRRSNIVLRAAAPLALGVGAGWTVLPITTRNVSDLAWKYEQRFPAVANTHLQIRDGVETGFSFARVHSEVGVRYVDEKVTDAREAVEGWVKKGK